MRTRSDLTAQYLAALALLLPWLNPFASGPSPAVVPWLASLSGLWIFLLITFFRRGDVRGLAAETWIVAAVLSSAIGLLQYFGVVFSPWINSAPVGEAFANLRQRNQFATLTNIGLVALLWWVIRTLQTTSDERVSTTTTMPVMHKVHAAGSSFAAAALLAAGNAASSSRTGMLQLILVFGIFTLWGRAAQPYVFRTLLAAGLTYLLAAFALPRLAGLDPSTTGILSRLNGGGPACTSRLTLWSNVLHLIAQKPWFGWGWGELDYAHFITLYPGPRFCDILDNAHNLPLHLAVELGLPVALLACGVGAWLVWQCKPWREVDPTRQLAWAVLAVIMLHSMLEYPLWYGPFQIATGLCIWLLWSTGKAARAGPPRVANAGNLGLGLRSAPARVMLGCLCMLLLAGVAYAAWDYHRVSQIYLAPSIRSPAYRENTLEKISGSWLFRNQVLFAELTTTEVSIDNAARIHDLALQMLHFSPEARVAEKLIESAAMLGRDDEVTFFRARYRAAFPVEYARWVKKTKGPLLEKQSLSD